TYYEWEEKTWPITREMQPTAVIFSDIGPDIRWVGNEKGIAAETSWATFTPVAPMEVNPRQVILTTGSWEVGSGMASIGFLPNAMCRSVRDGFTTRSRIMT